MKQRKPLPKQAVIGLVAGGVLLLALVGYMLLIKPQSARLKDVKAEIDSTQKTIDLYKQEAAQAKPNAVPKIRVADIYRLARAMPAGVDMPDVVIELNDVAQSAGVEIESIGPQAPAAGNGFVLVPMQLSFHGDFYAITDFLYRLRTLVDVRHGQLEAGGRLFVIETVGIQPSNAATSAPGSTTGAAAATAAASTDLEAQVKLDAFVYGAVPGASSGSTAAPAPAPASTDTTATTSTTPSSTTPTPSASAEGAP